LGLALQRPGQLAPFLHLLVIHEHFLEYRQLVRQQVEAQLLWAREHRGEAEPKELVAGRG